MSLNRTTKPAWAGWLSGTSARRKLLVATAAALAIVAVPGTASAGGSLFLDLPHLSIGLHDDYYGHRKRHYKRKYRHKRRYDRYDRHHSYDYYPRRTYRNRYYDDYYYDHDYRGGYSYDRGRSYRYRRGGEYCPTPGFSLRFYRNRGCYSHGNHYHCD